MLTRQQRGRCLQFAASNTCTYGARCKFEHVVANTSHAGRERKRSSRRSRQQYQGTATHLDDFFAQYPSFLYDPSSSVTSEFFRMCDFFDWGRDDDDKKTAREQLRNAMAQQFNAIYGTEVEDTNSWQGLCQVLEIYPIPGELEACRKAVCETNVNIVDLIDLPNTGGPLEIFTTELDLSTYTKSTGKYFPKENAYAGGLLRFLLRQIENPSDHRRSRGSGRRRRQR